MTDLRTTPADDPFRAPSQAYDDRAAAEPAGPATAETPEQPLYWRVLRLRHVFPNGWQRAVLVEGVIAIAVTLVLADVASAWTLVVLPTATAAVVKAHDLLTGMLRPERDRDQNRGRR